MFGVYRTIADVFPFLMFALVIGYLGMIFGLYELSKMRGLSEGQATFIIVVCIVFTPIVALLLMLVIPKNQELIDQRKLENKENYKECLFCLSVIPRKAIACKYCGFTQGAETLKVPEEEEDTSRPI